MKNIVKKIKSRMAEIDPREVARGALLLATLGAGAVIVKKSLDDRRQLKELKEANPNAEIVKTPYGTMIFSPDEIVYPE